MHIGLEKPSADRIQELRSEVEHELALDPEHYARFKVLADRTDTAFSLGLIHESQYRKTLRMNASITKELEVK